MKSRDAQRPTVLLDCDGVLSDFIGAVLPIVYVETGRYYEPHHVDRFDFCAALGLSDDEKRFVMREISSREGFCHNLDVLPGAVEGVARLGEIAEVYVVTSPWNSNRTWVHEREAWLAENFRIPHRRVIHTSAKHLVRGDVLVDDKTPTCAEWQAAHPKGIAVQWKTPHNRKDEWSGWATDGWDALREIVGGKVCPCRGGEGVKP